jgi:hypothetical protein
LFLTCGGDAAVMAENIARTHANTLTVVLLDLDLAVLAILPLSDTDDVEEVANLFYNTSARVPLPELAVLYVTADPPDGVDIREDAVLAWHRVRRTHIHAGVPAVDWLLVSNGFVRSMAETTGSLLPWRSRAI